MDTSIYEKFFKQYGNFEKRIKEIRKFKGFIDKTDLIY